MVSELFLGLVFSRNPERCALLILFVVCAGSVPLIENPISSLIFEHHRMKWLVSVLKRWKICEARLNQNMIMFMHVVLFNWMEHRVVSQHLTYVFLVSLSNSHHC